MQTFSTRIHYRVGDDSPGPTFAASANGSGGRDLQIRFGPPDNYVLIAGTEDAVIAWVKSLVVAMADTVGAEAAAAAAEARRRLEVVK